MQESPYSSLGQALDDIETVMRAPQPAGQVLRAQTFRVRERITKPDHSFMDRLRLVAREYGFSAHLSGYRHPDFSIVWVANERNPL